MLKLPSKEIGGITHYKDSLGWFSISPRKKRIPYRILYPIGGVKALDKLEVRRLGDCKLYKYRNKWCAVFIMNGVHFLYTIKEE